MSKSDCLFQLSFPSPLLLFPLRLLSPPSPSPEGAVIALVTSGYTEQVGTGLKFYELAMRHRGAAGAAAEIWCICLPMCSLALRKAWSMHADVLVVLCVPLCGRIFLYICRDGERQNLVCASLFFRLSSRVYACGVFSAGESRSK